MSNEPKYDTKNMSVKADDPIPTPTRDEISGQTVMQKIRSLIDNYLNWSEKITEKVNSIDPSGEAPVKSVNGEIGDVILSAGDIDMTDGRDVETAIGAIEDELGTDVDGINSRITALNSDLTAEKSARESADTALDTKISGKQDKLTTAQINAVNSGITKAKVTAYDGLQAQITTNKNSIDSEASTRALNDTELATQITAEENARQSGDSALDTKISGKQDKLTAGANITISDDNVISATGGGSGGTEYTAGDGIDISGTVISATDHAQVATNKNDIATLKTDKASVSALNTETEARTSADSALDTRVTATETKNTQQDADILANENRVNSLGTTLNGAFSEFSVSDNQLSMTTIGGTTYSQTLNLSNPINHFELYTPNTTSSFQIYISPTNKCCIIACITAGEYSGFNIFNHRNITSTQSITLDSLTFDVTLSNYDTLITYNPKSTYNLGATYVDIYTLSI